MPGKYEKRCKNKQNSYTYLFAKSENAMYKDNGSFLVVFQKGSGQAYVIVGCFSLDSVEIGFIPTALRRFNYGRYSGAYKSRGGWGESGVHQINPHCGEEKM